ncbi:hypothetical protein KL918_000138 [Ogataea parapolymorpha]|uniref:Homoserine O-acetyltransferase n=2 Tax=Ogataea TaxID=461281 RepID=W1Q9X8_OGAPD|nr:Homoserine O-acetyltransferase [Ogataea parapolymorpha DL-1]ACO07289.1 L-homoserine-O-acetyltransferase [Ogataea angusta]KAG7869934.1 hypothetical protein KL918_000138 [Ogataea parapolymorpha]ESW96190.1 Homoserine O-acetyltransferase [Ogataea parapolymorpha DL-1]KAG7873222.1 hypothetical protein KL916_002523 [Ogataea parapolymorpha]KAG7884832.1 hypothetical protein KL938_001089 [Ogataea parapolymorpha]
MGYKIVKEQPENPFSKLVSGQTIVEIPEFELESGDVLYKVPVAYKTWGKLNDKGDNCMLIAHALTGSADVKDWWGPLIGRDRAFDPTKYFIICLNSLGSPYGSASPVTMDPEYNQLYGPEFPICTVRDDVRIHKLVLDSLGVKQIAMCVGGSMGGMLALEWCFVDEGRFVKNLVALATSARHSAWCISWGEAQRQCIYSDPKYDDGYYSLEDPPVNGLGAARMAALLTYRSRNSFESRFGRGQPTEQQKNKSQQSTPGPDESNAIEDSPSAKEEHWQIHNHGASVHRRSFESRHASRSNSMDSSVSSADTESLSSATSARTRPRRRPQHYFSAQSYLRYQAQKFHHRFDANCYISITRKLDTHDVGRDRPEFDNDAAKALQSLKQPSLIIGIDSDALFTLSEQIFIAKNMPNSTLKKINSPEGHDAFLLEFKEINDLILNFEKAHIKEIMDHEGNNPDWQDDSTEQKESVFGEAEDVANW